MDFAKFNGAISNLESKGIVYGDHHNMFVVE